MNQYTRILYIGVLCTLFSTAGCSTKEKPQKLTPVDCQTQQCSDQGTLLSIPDNPLGYINVRDSTCLETSYCPGTIIGTLNVPANVTSLLSAKSTGGLYHIVLVQGESKESIEGYISSSVLE